MYDIILLVKSKMPKRIVDESDTVCIRRKLKANVSRSKVMELKRTREETIHFVGHTELVQGAQTSVNLVGGKMRIK